MVLLYNIKYGIIHLIEKLSKVERHNCIDSQRQDNWIIV